MNILQSPIWKKLFWIFSISLFILMPAISQDFGQNGDEDVESQYGRDIFNFYATGDQQALDYDTHLHPIYTTNITGMQFYGGMFDLMTESVHRVFPSWQIMDVRHFFSAILGALFFLFSGLLAYRLGNKKWWLAVLVLLFMAFSPRIFGESMNNGKDIPFALGMVMATYFFVRLMQDLTLSVQSWKTSIGLMVGVFIVFGMRPAGGLLLAAYLGLFFLVYIISNKEIKTALWENKYKLLKKTVLLLILVFIVGYGLALFTWPYGLVSPIGHLFSSLAEMSNRSVILSVLYDGFNYPSNQTPWHYNFKWIMISSPIVIIICWFLFFPFIPKAIKVYGLATVFILIFSALFPIFYIIYKQSTNFDSWRHVFFVYPYWVIMAALAVDVITSFLKDRIKWLPIAAVGVALMPTMIWTVRSHPNQYIYFNQFIGGAAGAFGYYDLDYYQATNREMMLWVLKHAEKPHNGNKLIVRSNMDGTDTYFKNDTSWVDANYARYYERNQKDWDYYVTYGRFVSPWQLQNGKWPPENVVYQVDVDGIPAGVVIKRSSKDSYYAYEALQKQDFSTAIEKYASYLKTDSSDEMVYLNYGIALASAGHIDQGVEALQKALTLNASNPNLYQILAQIYQAKGDMENAQKTMMQGQSILAQEQMRLNE